VLDRVRGWLGSLFGRGGQSGNAPRGGRGAAGGGAGGGRSGRVASKSAPARRGAIAGSGGKTSDDFWAFVDAVREVSADFDRYCRVAGDDAAAAGVRAVYATLPQTGKASRAAAIRRYLVNKARDGHSEDDAGLLAKLSERQVLQLARRAGMPI
jgi:hypothetical protein